MFLFLALKNRGTAFDGEMHQRGACPFEKDLFPARCRHNMKSARFTADYRIRVLYDWTSTGRAMAVNIGLQRREHVSSLDCLVPSGTRSSDLSEQLVECPDVCVPGPAASV